MNVTDAVNACLTNPGLQAAIIYRTYDDVRDRGRPALMACPLVGHGTWERVRHAMRYPNRSTLALRYATDHRDVMRFGGSDYQLILVADLDPDVIAFLRTRARSASADVPVLGLHLLTAEATR